MMTANLYCFEYTLYTMIFVIGFENDVSSNILYQLKSKLCGTRFVFIPTVIFDIKLSPVQC